MKIEHYLYKLDCELGKQNTNNKIMIYILAFIGIFAIPYMFLWDYSKEIYNSKQSSISAMQISINTDSMYLKKNTKKTIKIIQNDISKIKKDTKQNIKNSKYIDEKINTISSLTYNKEIWSQYLNFISKEANKNNVKIINLLSKDTKKNNEFSHLLNIYIKIQADYLNTLKFIDSIEKSNLVVDLHNFKMVSSNTLNSDLNISVWGILK